MSDDLFSYEVKCPVCREESAYTGVGPGTHDFYATHYYKHQLEAGTPPMLAQRLPQTDSQVERKENAKRD